MATGSGLRIWITRGILMLALSAMVISSMISNEPALGPGPRFDPPLLPGLDITLIGQILECMQGGFVMRHCSFFMS